MMRNVLTIALAVLTVSLQIPAVTQAQGVQPGSVSGRAVDAAGRGVTNQRLDLVRGGQVVSTAATNTRGEWAFRNVNAGEYVIRTSVNGKIAGVRVTVASGQALAGTMIVVPAAAVSPQFGALSSIVSSLASAGATGAVSAVQNVVSPAEATDLNATEIATIFNSLPAAQQVQFAQAVVQATSTSESPNTFKPASTETTATSTNQTTNQAIFTVLQQVAQAPANTTVQSTITITPSTGTTTGTIQATVPNSSGTGSQTVVNQIPTSVS